MAPIQKLTHSSIQIKELSKLQNSSQRVLPNLGKFSVFRILECLCACVQISEKRHGCSTAETLGDSLGQSLTLSDILRHSQFSTHCSRAGIKYQQKNDNYGSLDFLLTEDNWKTFTFFGIFKASSILDFTRSRPCLTMHVYSVEKCLCPNTS